jgi:hypothetical protein
MVPVGSRNRQRATFEKRQREIQRRERQALKRARRHGKGEGDAGPAEAKPSATEFPLGLYPDELDKPTEPQES